MYAIIELKGNQYIVQEGEQFEVDNMNLPEGEEFDLNTVLAKFNGEVENNNGENILLGQPYLDNVNIKLKVIKNFVGEKIEVYKFRRKTRYARHQGFRPQKTILLVQNIQA